MRFPPLPITARAASLSALLMLGAVGCSSNDDPATVVVTTTIGVAVPATSTSTTSTTSTTTTTTTTTTLPPTTVPPTTTTEPIVTAGGPVLVANASRVPGAAGRLTAALTDIGFAMNTPVNGAGTDEELDASRVYARDVTDPVALSIVRLMGGIPVLRMPTPLPVESGSAGDATVVVMLGKDLAEGDLPGV